MFRNGCAEKCVPLVDFPDGVANYASGGLLDQIAHPAGFDRLDNISFITVRRKKEHLGCGAEFDDLTGSLKSIEQGHRHVHKNQSGTEFFTMATA